MAAKFAAIGKDRPASKFLTVEGPTLAAFANSDCDKFTAARAARQSEGVNVGLLTIYAMYNEKR